MPVHPSDHRFRFDMNEFYVVVDEPSDEIPSQWMTMIYVRRYEAEKRAEQDGGKPVKTYTVQLDRMRNVEKFARMVKAADAFTEPYKANMAAAALAMTFRKGLAWTKLAYVSYAAWDGSDTDELEEALFAVQPLSVTPLWNCLAKNGTCDLMFGFRDEKHLIHGRLAGLPIQKHVKVSP